jgi:hypothetical protein
MPEMRSVCPLNELELTDQHRPKPATILHLRGCQAGEVLVANAFGIVAVSSRKAWLLNWLIQQLLQSFLSTQFFLSTLFICQRRVVHVFMIGLEFLPTLNPHTDDPNEKYNRSDPK